MVSLPLSNVHHNKQCAIEYRVAYKMRHAGEGCKDDTSIDIAQVIADSHTYFGDGV